jgi:hypothetical protein
MHYYAMKVHRAAGNSQLHRAKSPVPLAHVNHIVIVVTVHVSASKKSPSAFIVPVLSVKRGAESKRGDEAK